MWQVAYVGLCIYAIYQYIHVGVECSWMSRLQHSIDTKNVTDGEIRKWLVIYGLGQCNGTALSASTLDQYIYTTKEKCFVR